MLSTNVVKWGHIGGGKAVAVAGAALAVMLMVVLLMAAGASAHESPYGKGSKNESARSLNAHKRALKQPHAVAHSARSSWS
jgi:hypothetical protein